MKNQKNTQNLNNNNIFIILLIILNLLLLSFLLLFNKNDNNKHIKTNKKKLYKKTILNILFSILQHLIPDFLNNHINKKHIIKNNEEISIINKIKNLIFSVFTESNIKYDQLYKISTFLFNDLMPMLNKIQNLSWYSIELTTKDKINELKFIILSFKLYLTNNTLYNNVIVQNSIIRLLNEIEKIIDIKLNNNYDIDITSMIKMRFPYDKMYKISNIIEKSTEDIKKVLIIDNNDIKNQILEINSEEKELIQWLIDEMEENDIERLKIYIDNLKLSIKQFLYYYKNNEMNKNIKIYIENIQKSLNIWFSNRTLKNEKLSKINFINKFLNEQFINKLYQDDNGEFFILKFRNYLNID